MLSNQIQAFLKQASLTAKITNNPAETITIQAILITPEGQYTALGCERMVEAADFVSNSAETVQIRLRLQPSVYFDRIVKYRDDLRIQVIKDSGTDRLVTEYIGVPLVDRDVRAESNNTAAAQLDALDTTQLVAYEFQLLPPGFAEINNIPVSGIYPMSTVENVLATVMETETQKVNLTGYDKYKGMYFHRPVDNPNNYRQIIFPSGTRLKDVPRYLQNHNEYGVYSKGLGSFYKQNYWWIYPLFNTTLSDTHPRPIDIIRVPENKIPDLDHTFYRSDISMTVIACGTGTHKDRADIRKQNEGLGQRVVMGDAVAGDTGYHYNNGRAITTRADSMQEYKLSERRNGKEWTPIDLNPTGNVCAPMSVNALNEGEIVEVEWRNGDTGYLEPGHPLRYQYMHDDDTMTLRRGVLLGYRTDYIPITTQVTPMLKRTTILKIFLKRQEKYKA